MLISSILWAGAVLLSILVYMWHWRGFRAYFMIKGLSPLSRIPIFGDAFIVATIKPRDMFDKMYEFSIGQKYKLVFLLGLPIITLYHPDDIEILLGSMMYLKKGFEYFPLYNWLREGLLISDGNKWRQRRKLLTPTFHFSILEGNVGQIGSHAKVFVQNLLQTGGKPIVLDDIVRHYTLDIICETAMGIKLDGQDSKSTGYVEAIKSATEKALKRIQQLWLYREWAYALTTDGKIFNRDIETLHKFTEEVISARKKKFEEQKDEEKKTKRKAFLDLLLETEEKNPGSLSSLGIREEVDTFMFEGHDTTSAAIVHALYSLATNPQVQERCWEEQEEIFGEDEREASREDLTQMSYLDMVIKEVLRLYPSVPYISRTLTGDLKLSDGRVLPARANVVVVPYLVHRREDFWEEPEEFRPERFLPGTVRHPYSYIPFSAGPRNCIGMKFAMLELKTTLSAVVRYCRIEPVTTKLNLVPNIILKNDELIQVRILPRRGVC